MIRSRKQPPGETVIEDIVKTLADEHAHGHAIGRVAARDIGLPITDAVDPVEALMWALLKEYEADLKLLEPLDPVTAVATTDFYTEDATIWVVESTWGVHTFDGQIEVRATHECRAISTSPLPT